MGTAEVDIVAFGLMLLRWFGVLFLLYLVVIIGLRFSNYYKFNRCPHCSGELKRASRTGSDRLLNSTSFGILPVKRYRCYTCYWEGQALEIRELKKKKDADADVVADA